MKRNQILGLLLFAITAFSASQNLAKADDDQQCVTKDNHSVTDVHSVPTPEEVRKAAIAAQPQQAGATDGTQQAAPAPKTRTVSDPGSDQ